MAKKTSSKERERLQALIEEATADCYNEYEQFSGFLNMVEENVACPFPARVLGEAVEAVSLEAAEGGFGINAVCRYKGKEYRVEIGSLEWPRQKPEGYEWIEAFFAWRKTIG